MDSGLLAGGEPKRPRAQWKQALWDTAIAELHRSGKWPFRWQGIRRRDLETLQQQAAAGGDGEGALRDSARRDDVDGGQGATEIVAGPAPGSATHLPEPVRPELWVALAASPGVTGYLTGNPHLAPGQITVWVPADASSPGREEHVRVRDIAICSRASGWWIQGFLAANAPQPPDETVDGGEVRFERWLAKLRHFRATGDWLTRIKRSPRS